MAMNSLDAFYDFARDFFGLHRQSRVEPVQVLADAIRERTRLREALMQTAERFDDLATLIERGEHFTNSAFLRASAYRCRQTLNGARFGDNLNKGSATSGQ